MSENIRTGPERTFKYVQWIAVALIIVGIEAALLYKLIEGGGESSPMELTAICVLAIVVVLASNADSLKLISLGKEGFRAELEVLQKKTSRHDQTITEMVALSMGRDAYQNLRKLARGAFGPYEKEPHMGLETELYHLRNLGYVVLNTAKARSIHEIPASGEQLSDYVEVTDAGKKYIRLREELALGV
jgi:hypothetical protein